ncbi:hypothetical protein ACQCVK_12040 [Rossellomorea vietnamensis]|uniref:Uncharacterized protein n=1 Tax=Rossellomorea aquimaris TaxID=189382 RepID=A0A5D4TEF0_9BACI|nr:hypothetical protein [Rossellomorea aquimaris]TYS74007.1 hypothetical protein FZC80_19335 [Rossellomorea aquimaris]
MSQNEMQLLMKKLLKLHLEGQVEDLKREGQSGNSLVFLEGSTLNLLLLSLVMKDTEYSPKKETDPGMPVGVPSELFKMIEEAAERNEKDFKEIIALLENELR